MADVEQGALDAASAEIAATGVQVLAQRWMYRNMNRSKHWPCGDPSSRFGAPHWCSTTPALAPAA